MCVTRDDEVNETREDGLSFVMMTVETRAKEYKYLYRKKVYPQSVYE